MTLIHEKAQKEDFYADQERVAVHLEMEWSDFIIEPTNAPPSAIEWPDPRRDRTAPTFYKMFCRQTCVWLAQRHIAPMSHCDVGGGTGRALHELACALPSLRDLVLIEPSENLARWAHLLLTTCDQLTFPTDSSQGMSSRDRTMRRPHPINQGDRQVSIQTQTIEQAVLPDGSFQLVTCLNVIDRHPEPRKLVHRLHKILASEGLLVIASPLDFLERITPRCHWVTDLGALFETPGWERVGQTDLALDVRTSNRSWTRYVSQVVGMAKKAS